MNLESWGSAGSGHTHRVRSGSGDYIYDQLPQWQCGDANIDAVAFRRDSSLSPSPQHRHGVANDAPCNVRLAVALPAARCVLRGREEGFGGAEHRELLADELREVIQALAGQPRVRRRLRAAVSVGVWRFARGARARTYRDLGRARVDCRVDGARRG